MRSRQMMLALAVVFSGQAFAQVTADLQVSTVEAALAQLQPQLSKPHRVARNLSKEFVYINVTDVTEVQLRKQLADALGGEWEESAESWTLTFSNRVETQQRNQRLAAEREALASALAPAKEGAAGEQPQFRMPDGMTSLANGLVRGVDIDDIAAMPPMSRRVFSTNPSAMQGRLGAKAAEIAAEYLGKARKRRESPNDMDFESRIGAVIPPAGAKPKDIVLTVLRTGDDLSWTLFAIAYGPNGEIYGMDFGFLMGQMKPRTKTARQFTDPVKVVVDPALKSISSAGGSSMGMAMGGMFRVEFATANIERAAPADPKVIDPLRQKLSDPAKTEPLELVVGPVLDQMAKAHGLDVVASLPDRLVRDVFSMGSSLDAMTTQQWLEALSTRLAMDVLGDGSTLTLRPEWAVREREARTDRAALSKLIGGIQTTGMTTLDGMANYAMTRDGFPMRSSLDLTILGVLGGEYQTAMTQLGDAASSMMLKYYAKMDNGQRQIIGSDRRMPLRALHPEQQSVVKGLVFNTMEGPILDQANPRQRGRGQREERVDPMAMMQRQFMLSNERTVVFANGFAPMANATVSSAIAPATIAKGGAMSQLQDVTTATFSQLQRDGSMPWMPAGNNFTPESYLPVTQVNYTFRFELGGGWVLVRQLSELKPIPGAKYGPYDSLPEEFRNRVAESVAQMKRNLQNGNLRFRETTNRG